MQVLINEGDAAIPVKAGKRYTILFETLSICDWRVELKNKVYDKGALFERWGAEGWDIVFPACDATFRTYVEPIPDGMPECV